MAGVKVPVSLPARANAVAATALSRTKGKEVGDGPRDGLLSCGTCRACGEQGHLQVLEEGVEHGRKAGYGARATARKAPDVFGTMRSQGRRKAEVRPNDLLSDLAEGDQVG